MPEVIIDLYKVTSIIDLSYIIITIFSLIKCFKKGFVLSILSMAKWLLAYVITLLIFPRIKPYFKDIIDNEYVLDDGDDELERRVSILEEEGGNEYKSYNIKKYYK